LEQRVEQIGDADDDANDDENGEHAQSHVFHVFDEVLRLKGESLRALEELVRRSGGIICGKMAILAEGDAQTREDLIYLEKLPLFDIEGNIIG
jgi:adenine phosphoribosyltransferase